MRISLVVIAAAIATLLTSCASEDKAKPWHRSEHKWYQGDMDTEDRNFFLGSFFDGNSR